ncbi:hypothetical protein BWI17_19295 [Betaproteobacteria bacterium GR16-43]|nr:hypothetical protein BWI17_19295 [Betaproteobacteria bacterium GR16-43]
MNETVRRILAAVGLVLVLGGAGVTVQKHEATLAEGRLMLLELAPVDPRSLMQGDYMALRFKIAEKLGREQGDGRFVVKVDDRNVAAFVRVHAGAMLSPGEALVEFRVRNGNVRIVTNAFFFEEGRGGSFNAARYGEFRVRPDGVALLTGLRDAALNVIVAPNVIPAKAGIQPAKK